MIKNALKSICLLAASALALHSCSDVPAPYPVPGGGNNNGYYINESFANSLGQFTSFSAEGSLAWKNDFQSAMITGYQDFNGDGSKENQPGTTYLVSQAIDLTNSQNAYITFNHAIAYERGTMADNHFLLICKDFNGDVKTAAWKSLEFNTEGTNVSGSFVFVSSGQIAVPSEYIGQKNVFVALMHKCTDAYSSTWKVKNFKVVEGVAEGTTPEPPVENESSKENPYSVSKAISLYNAAKPMANTWVKGYIVGFVEGMNIEEGAKFTAENASATNMLIAESAAETDYKKCLVIQLPSGDIRARLNLKDHPENLGKEVILKGSLEEYFKTYGLKTVTAYVIDGEDSENKPDLPKTTFTKVTSISDGTYIMAVSSKGAYKVAKNITGNPYGYLYVNDATSDGNTISIAAEGLTFTITNTENGYTIQDESGRFMIMKGTFNSFNLEENPASGQYWDITSNPDGSFTMTNKEMNKWIQYSEEHTSFGCYPDERGLKPMLFKK